MEKKVEKKKPAGDMWKDMIDYSSERILLSINAAEEPDIVAEMKAYVDSALFLLVGDQNVKETIMRIVDIDNLREEFLKNFGDRYEKGCAQCGCETEESHEGC